jgi:hypothetical protein
MKESECSFVDSQQYGEMATLATIEELREQKLEDKGESCTQLQTSKPRKV